MEPSQFLTALVGAFLGSAGWLFVGVYMQRRAATNLSRSAARAVYFEVAMNEIDVRVAADHLVFQPLRRGSFDRLLPELSTWLRAEELECIVRAYMSQAGYEQAQRDEKLPAPVRMAVLRTVADQHKTAANLLRAKAFGARDAARLAALAGHTAADSAPPVTRSAAATGTRNA